MVGENFEIYLSEMAIYSSSENNSHFDKSAPNTENPPPFKPSPLFVIPPLYTGNFVSPGYGHFSDFPSPP